MRRGFPIRFCFDSQATDLSVEKQSESFEVLTNFPAFHW